LDKQVNSSCVITILTPQGEFRLPFQPGATLRDILAAGGFPVRSACGGNAGCGRCLVRVKDSHCIPYAEGERHRLSETQLSAGWRLACRLNPTTNLNISIEAPAIKTHWRPLRDDEYRPPVRPLMLRPAIMRYGVAIDLGTTHIRLTLWDLPAGKRLAGRAGLNPQACYGADVLTRLMEAGRSKAIADEISGLARTAIGDALTGVASKLAIDLQDVGAVRVVGNTAMMGLLSGKNAGLLLQPEYWTQRLDIQPDDISPLQKAWGLSGNSVIRFITPLGGFIGSDLLAGIIATRLIEQAAGALLIDIGTNSEMALWDGEKLRVTSTAGGPAFEGCGISCGMPAEAGAIYRLQSGHGNSFELGVLGNGKSSGVCGSGLVDAVAWLRHRGMLDKLGRYRDDRGEGFVLSETDRRIVLTRSDIDVFQRAKASIGGGVCRLCDQAGIAVASLSHVYVSGAFGRLLDVTNAQALGLLPPVPIERVHLEGNTALAGCEELLLSSEGERAAAAVLAVSEVYNMAEDVAFESLFVENLYLQPMRE